MELRTARYSVKNDVEVAALGPHPLHPARVEPVYDDRAAKLDASSWVVCEQLGQRERVVKPEAVREEDQIAGDPSLLQRRERLCRGGVGRARGRPRVGPTVACPVIGAVPGEARVREGTERSTEADGRQRRVLSTGAPQDAASAL